MPALSFNTLVITKRTSPVIARKSNPDGNVGAASTYPACVRNACSEAALAPVPWLPWPATISGNAPHAGVAPGPDPDAG